MKKVATWIPFLAAFAVILMAAAPARKTSDRIKPTSPSSASVVESSSLSAETAPVDSPAGVGDHTSGTPLNTSNPGDPTAASTQGGSYSIDWYSINGGGTIDASSTNYKMGASIGQSVAGAATSTNYQMGIGFWYGAGSGACACDCHADPGACDGVQTVLDVVQEVNVAFRNAAAIPDPNASCPYQTTDVNCDNVTTVLDVVKMVNVAFRNGNPAVEFCNPCA